MSNSVSDSQSPQWKLLLVLAMSGFVASASLSAFFWRQNTYLALQRQQLQTQIANAQVFLQNERNLAALIQDVANFSAQHPDARAILQKYGLTVNLPQPPPAQPAITSPPSVPSKR